MIPGIVAGQASAYMPPGNLWTPANLAVAAKIWCDDSSIVDSGGGVSGQWTDKSANGWHFTQATSGNRPQILAAELNGHSVLRFDGSDDRLVHSGSGADIFRNTGSGWSLTLYKKRSSDFPPGSAVMFYAPPSAAGGFETNRFNVITIRASTPDYGGFATRRQLTDTTVVLGRSSSDIGNWVMRIDIADWTNGDAFMHVNGELDASDTTTMTGGSTSNVAIPFLSIGAGGTSASTGGNYSDVDVAVVIAGSGSLPDSTEIDKLFGWAAWRYGLQSNLPDDHPYKDAPPTV
jgi:hypothetical protein